MYYGSSFVGGCIGHSNSDKIICCGYTPDITNILLFNSKEPGGLYYFGGIAGGINRDTIIQSCYSHIKKLHSCSIAGPKYYYGGIAANCSYTAPYVDKGYIKNCYSILNSLENDTQRISFGGIVSINYNSDSSKLSDNYSNNNVVFTEKPYNNQYGYDGNTTYKSTEFASGDFVNLLNIYPTVNNYQYRWFQKYD